MGGRLLKGSFPELKAEPLIAGEVHGVQNGGDSIFSGVAQDADQDTDALSGRGTWPDGDDLPGRGVFSLRIQWESIVYAHLGAKRLSYPIPVATFGADSNQLMEG